MERDGRLNDRNWMARHGRNKAGWRLVRDTEVKVGEHYEYRGRTAVTPQATYDAKVIKITKHLIVMDLKYKKDDDSLGDPMPYSFAIPRLDVGHTERLYQRVEEVVEC